MWLHLWRNCGAYIMRSRFYSSGMDWKKLQLTIMDRIENRHKPQSVQNIVPVAKEVLFVRTLVVQGVSTLLQAIPTVSCKFCSEVYVNEEGHSIRSCGGSIGTPKNRKHHWIPAGLNDILVPVETFRLNNMLKKGIEHDQRCESGHFPAVVELCRLAGVDSKSLDSVPSVTTETKYSPEDLTFIANGTLRAWETLRQGVKKLLTVHPAKVCKCCSEVRVGQFGQRPQLQLPQIYKHESLEGWQFWQRAGVNDLVPENVVWHQRPQDPPALLHEGKRFYGHAPAVVSLCAKAGATVPRKYFCMMKIQGLRAAV